MRFNNWGQTTIYFEGSQSGHFYGQRLKSGDFQAERGRGAASLAGRRPALWAR